MTEFLTESSAPAALAGPSPEAAGAHPRAARSRAGGLAAAAVIALLAAGAAGCSSGSSAQPKSGGSGTAGVATGIKVPAKIGTLTKGADGPMDASGVPKSVQKNLHAVNYADGGDSLHSVTITGGLGLPVPSDGPTDKVARLFSLWDVGSAGSKLASVPAGSAGGTAECTPYDTQYKHLDCGWVSGKVALVMNFTGLKAARVRALVPQILSAMVVTK